MKTMNFILSIKSTLQVDLKSGIFIPATSEFISSEYFKNQFQEKREIEKKEFISFHHDDFLLLKHDEKENIHLFLTSTLSIEEIYKLQRLYKQNVYPLEYIIDEIQLIKKCQICEKEKENQIFNLMNAFLTQPKLAPYDNMEQQSSSSNQSPYEDYDHTQPDSRIEEIKTLTQQLGLLTNPTFFDLTRKFFQSLKHSIYKDEDFQLTTSEMLQIPILVTLIPNELKEKLMNILSKLPRFASYIWNHFSNFELNLQIDQQNQFILRCLRSLVRWELSVASSLEKKENPLIHSFFYPLSLIERILFLHNAKFFLFSSQESLSNLRTFVGPELYDELDLSESVITGSAIMASCYKYRSYLIKMNYLEQLALYYPKYYTMLASSETKIEDDFLIYGEIKDYKYIVELIYKDKKIPFFFKNGADVDLAVVGSNFEQIAKEHIQLIQKIYSKERVCIEKEERKNGTSYKLFDYQHEFRSIHIYPSSINRILTHHIAPVRGYCTSLKGQKEIFLATSAILCAEQKSIKNFHYFAGKKLPWNVVFKTKIRGFSISMDGPFYSLFHHIEDFYCTEVSEKIIQKTRGTERTYFFIYKYKMPCHEKFVTGYDIRTLPLERKLFYQPETETP